MLARFFIINCLLYFCLSRYILCHFVYFVFKVEPFLFAMVFKKNNFCCLFPAVIFFFVSVFSFFLSSLLVKVVGSFFLTEFNFAARKGIGNISLIILVLSSLIHLLFALDFYSGIRSSFAEQLGSETGSKNLSSVIRTYFAWFLFFASIHFFLIIVAEFCGALSISFSTIVQKIFSIRWLQKNIFRLLGSFVGLFALGFAEEFIFRELILRIVSFFVSRRISAITLSSLLFSLSHLHTEGFVGKGPTPGLLTRLLFLFFMGALLSVLRLKKGSILPGAGAHSGLVFPKVLQRRFGFINYRNGSHAGSSVFTIFFPADLRDSILVVSLIGAVFCLILIRDRKYFFGTVEEVAT